MEYCSELVCVKGTEGKGEYWVIPLWIIEKLDVCGANRAHKYHAAEDVNSAYKLLVLDYCEYLY